MSILILMELPLVADKVEEAKAVFAEFLPVTRAFDGCESITQFTDQADPTKWIFLEYWESAEKYQAYMDFRMARPADGEKLMGVLAGPPVVRTLDPGTA